MVEQSSDRKKDGSLVLVSSTSSRHTYLPEDEACRLFIWAGRCLPKFIVHPAIRRSPGLEEQKGVGRCKLEPPAGLQSGYA